MKSEKFTRVESRFAGAAELLFHRVKNWVVPIDSFSLAHRWGCGHAPVVTYFIYPPTHQLIGGAASWGHVWFYLIFFYVTFWLLMVLFLRGRGKSLTAEAQRTLSFSQREVAEGIEN